MAKNRAQIIGSIILAVLGLCLLIAVIFWAKSLSDFETTYEDAIEKTYTYRKHSHVSGKNAYYLIYVEEEENPLIIYSIYVSQMDKNVLASLKKGDHLSCYVVEAAREDYAYEVVEIKSKQGDILTLEGYNKAGLFNQRVGCAVIAVIGTFFLFLGTVLLVKYRYPNRFAWL